MANFVLIVEFEIQPENADKFVELINENARQSVKLEPGCHQFDVVRALDDKTKIKLYEVYEDEAAFQAHIKMPHVADFFGKAKPMIVKQTAHRTERLAAPKK